MFIKQMRRLASALGAGSTENVCDSKLRNEDRRCAKKRSKLLDKAIKADWKTEEKNIKLLLLGKPYIHCGISLFF